MEDNNQTTDALKSLWHEFKKIAADIDTVSAIVQNACTTPSRTELSKFSDDMDIIADKVQDVKTKTITHFDKCTRCGQCCLASPCSDKGEYVKIQGQTVHICKQFSLENGIATCDLRTKGQVIVHPHCTSLRRYEYDFDIEAIEEFLKNRKR